MITLINVLFGIDVPFGIYGLFGWRGRMCASADFVKQHHAAIDPQLLKLIFVDIK